MSDLFRAGERLSAAKLNRLLELANTLLGEAPDDGAGYVRLGKAWVKESECFLVALGDEVSPLVTATPAITFHMPFAFTVTEVMAGLTAVSSSGLVRFDVNLNGVSIFTTRVSVDQGEETSLTAATPAVLATTVLPRGGKITIDVDDAGAGATGAKIYFNGRRG